MAIGQTTGVAEGLLIDEPEKDKSPEKEGLNGQRY